MKHFLLFLVSILIIQKSVAPPVTREKKEENEISDDDMENVLEYSRYLKEVVQTLVSDKHFSALLEAADEKDIRNGNIAHQLDFVSNKVRTKLDELKRTEVERLRHLANKVYKLENGLDDDHLKIAGHLMHKTDTFEIDDLKKLIIKSTKDLEEADNLRRKEFKEYEMNKKYEQEEKKKTMNEDDKKKYEENLHDLEKKHKEHEPLHHPGSKKQLEEVWEKQDHMENQQFDPKTFFYLHDLDGNGVWDQYELKALFVKELDKLYSEGHAEDDLVERAEEMERMREHVIREADLNKDGFISYEEFLKESKKDEFEKDPGWESLDEQQIYSEQEYEAYKMQKIREMEQQLQQNQAGHPQAGYGQHPNQVPPHGYVQHQMPPQQHYPEHVQYVNHEQQGHVNQMHPQMGQYQQMPPQAGQYQQMPPHAGQYQQMPPQAGQYQQMPPHAGQYQQMPQQGQFVNQASPQQHEQLHPNNAMPAINSNQIPQQGQFVNQVPQQHQQQYQSNQVPSVANTNQMPDQHNYPNANQQAVGQNPVPHQQQFQQPPVLHQNQIVQQEMHPSGGQQLNQQPVGLNSNSIPHQQMQQTNDQQLHHQSESLNKNAVPQQIHQSGNQQQVHHQADHNSAQQQMHESAGQQQAQQHQQQPQQHQQPAVPNNLNEASQHNQHKVDPAHLSNQQPPVAAGKH